MAYPLELSGAERRAYHKALRNHHAMESSVVILNRDEQAQGERLTRVLDGWVEINTEAGATQPTRRLTVRLLDRSNRLAIDTSSPAEAALGADRFIRAFYTVKVAGSQDVNVPIFTGPIETVRRRGAEVEVTAVGKEALMLDPYLTWTAQTYGKRVEVVSAIRQIAAGLGETHFRLPQEAIQVLRKPLSVAPFEEAWPLVQRLAKRIGRYAYYDGRGRLTLRQIHRENPSMTFDGRYVTSEPEILVDFTLIRNAAVVRGEEVHGEQRRKITIRHWLAPANPLSPKAMAREGTPRYAVVVEDSSFKRRDRLRQRSRELLDANSDLTCEANFDSLVVPHLEERDVCRIDMPEDFGDINYRFVIRRLRIPLAGGAPMTVGNLRRYDSPTARSRTVVKTKRPRRR